MIRQSRSQRPRSFLRFARCGAGILVGLWCLGDVAMAGDGVPRLADKEVAKREALLAEAQKLVTEAGALFNSGDYDGAMKGYRQAWEMLPDAPMAAPWKAAARDGYSRASNAQARKLAKQ